MKKIILILMTCAVALGLNAQPAGDAQSCPGLSTVKDYDNNVYNTVKIGTQCWMKQNLRTTHYANGDPIYSGGNSSSTTTPYYYNNSSSSIPLSLRGYMYNWAAVMHGAAASDNVPSGVQGICPNGWHLPSYSEGWALINYLRSQSYYYCGSSSSNIARALAYTSYWKSSSNSCAIGNTQSANNASGFSAVPVGDWVSVDDQGFSWETWDAYFWTTSLYSGSTGVHFINLEYQRSDYSNILNSGATMYPDCGLSVRCVHTDPTVTTSSVSSSNLHPTWAVCGGTVTYSYTDLTITRGICWSTSSNPTISNSHTSSGTGAGSFSTNITGLTPNTKYYVRAYATTSLGTVYGNQVSFTTPAFRNPTVTTSSVTNIGTNSATCGGTVVDSYNDGISVTARGVCWSMSPSPTISNARTTNGSGTGSFTSSITGLIPNTTYYVRAYATTSNGTVYGNEKSFTSGCNTVNVSITGNTTIAAGTSTTLTASGASTYRWSNNSTSASITVSPSSTTYYSVTGTNTYGCTGTNGVSVSVIHSPVVTTGSIYNLDYTSATCSANLVDNGGESLMICGMCWRTSHNPVVSDAHSEVLVTSTGTFTSSFGGLTPGTTYYLRAYATNTAGTTYGNEISFTTPCQLEADNITVSDITMGSAVIGWDGSNDSYNLRFRTLNGDWSWISNADPPFSLTNLTPATSYEVQVQGVCSNGNSEWSDVVEFHTDICSPEDQCELTFVLTDSYGDGWNGNAIQVTDVESGIVLATLANEDLDGDSGNIEESQTVTLSVCDGRTVRFDWINGNWSGETSYEVYNHLGNMFFSGSGGFSAPFDYTVHCCLSPLDVSIEGRITIPSGMSTTLTASGASTYSWSNGSMGDSLTVSPTGTTNYTVTGTNQYGCTGTKTVTVTVYPACISCPDYDDELNISGSGEWIYVSDNTEVSGGCRTYKIDNVSNQYKYTFETGCEHGTAGFDTFLELYDASCSLVEFNDDACNNTWSRIVFVPSENGTYYLKVKGFNYSSFGPYTLACQRGLMAVPTVSTNSVTNIGEYTATCGGNITADGFCNVTARGVCWSTNHNPTTADAHTSNGNGTGEFTSIITGLNLETTYYVRAYATNDKGTAYGEEMAFNTVRLCPSEDRCDLTFVLTDSFGDGWTGNAITVTDVETEELIAIMANENLDGVSVDIEETQTLTLALCNGRALRFEWVTGAYPEDVSYAVYDGRGEEIFSGAGGFSDPITYTVNCCDKIVLDASNNYTYTENFDGYTTSTTSATGVEPACWELVQRDVSMTNANRPQLCYNSAFAHSGDYSLKLYYRGVYAMPELNLGEGTTISQVKLEMYLRQANAKYQLQVGVWEEDSTFVPVATFNNNTTEVEYVTCDFKGYEGRGGRIAFRNTLGSGTGSASSNYLDDIKLSILCEGITLPYTENFDSYTTSTTSATGVEPRCWELVQVDAPSMPEDKRPQLCYNSSFAHSGDYSLKLYNRGVYAMPELNLEEGTTIRQVKLEMYLRQANAKYQLEVGVWEESGTFVPVATFNNSSTEVEYVACDFSDYRGSGGRIAFRNTLGSGTTAFSSNYLDDITLTKLADCSVSLPYSENFDSYTTVTATETGVEPDCWEVVTEDVALTNATRPQLYHGYATSGDYSLRLKNRCVYAMPELAEGVNVNQLTMTFKLRQASAVYRLQVGVVEANGAFTVVKTINNTTTDMEDVVVKFSSYTGSGKRIAFRNTVKSGSTLAYSTNYIDDIVLGYSCDIVELPYTEDFDSYTTETAAETGVEPDCWEVVTEDVALTNATRPQLYHGYATSGDYSLRLKNRCVYAMPALGEEIDIKGLEMRFKLRQANAVYRLQVGVVEENGAFTVVKTINNASTDMEDVVVKFSGYTGSGKRIAFRNTVKSGSTLAYSTNYIDDIVLDYTCDIVDLPYTEDFDSYTTVTATETGVEPDCWEVVTEDVSLTNATKPQLYRGFSTSGDYSLRLKNRCVYAMPELAEGINVKALTMTFQLRQANAVYRLQVGVVEENGAFTAVKTINNATTEMESVTVSFSGYTGTGRRIAFRNTLKSGSTLAYSTNYIDDINITPASKIENVSDVNVTGSEGMDSYLDRITVYPNPTTGMVQIEAVDVQKVECYNQMGQLVGVYENVNELNLSDLAKGVYTLRITVPQGVAVRKVVKR